MKTVVITVASDKAFDVLEDADRLRHEFLYGTMLVSFKTEYDGTAWVCEAVYRGIDAQRST